MGVRPHQFSQNCHAGVIRLKVGRTFLSARVARDHRSWRIRAGLKPAPTTGGVELDLDLVDEPAHPFQILHVDPPDVSRIPSDS